ncbi:MAG: hypothetical protein JNL54_18605 [Kineosporiaceae bacterium]|nr:hypothetical protein [Kineosporiaceae bacterium]
MPDVTAAAIEVGEMIMHALTNALGLGPDAALADAKLATGVTDEDIDNADMGEVFDYLCMQPGLSPQLHTFLTDMSQTYGSGNTVYQGGSSASGGTVGGGHGGGHGGGGHGGGGGYGGGGNAQVVQAVTQNYYEQTIIDNSSDTNFIGNFTGDIDVDNDHIDVSGDNNAVNSGEGDQNAATGDGSSAAQSGSGDAQSNSGDDSILNQDGLQLGQFNTGDEAAQVLGPNQGVVNTGDAAEIANVQGNADGAGFQFGDGSTQGVASGNYLEEGSALSGTGNATGQSVETNVNSDVTEEHGDGDNLDVELGSLGRPQTIREVDLPNGTSGGDGGGHGGGHGDHYTPEVNVTVEGGEGDQIVDDTPDM